ncbi:MAG TPA: cysteine desulfurase family protein [Caulobacteraceae bacterium]|jgi:cysteine desulfurase
MSVYLDYNATAPVRPEVLEAVTAALVDGGNPSSIHAAGRKARATMERAREQVAELIGAAPNRLVFTSGGTEANALAIESAVAAGSRCLLISAAEHPSVRESAHASDAEVEEWPVDVDGRADLPWLCDRLARWDAEREGPPFAALMLANNETGVIQPVEVAAAMLHQHGGRLHVDAVQAAGKVLVDMEALGADTLSVAAHKLGGPGGVGALAYAPGAPVRRRLHGGGQERGLRAGTENVCGIAGFGAAAEAARKGLSRFADQAEWRDAAAARLHEKAPVIVLAENVERLPNTLCFATSGFEAARQLMALDLAQVMVSAGSACSSGKVKPSHVLTAMGLEEQAGCAIRVSGGWATTEADWVKFVEVWLEAYERHRSLRAA